jgi:hypothetical protein
LFSSYKLNIMTGKFSRTFYCIMEPNICVLISTKGILSHSIVYIHVRAPEYISLISFLFKLHLNFWLVYIRKTFWRKFSRTLLWLFQYCRSYWPFRGICCVCGVLVSLWLTVLVWGRMCFSTQHNIFLKWMCTYNWCCLILTKNST